MNLYKDKLYIIGSLSQEEVIKSTADYYIGTGRYRVRYVKKEPQKSLKSLIQKCFLNIIWADRVLIIPKHDGTLGNGEKYWWQMIQLLPSSYNQKRTVMLNYEVLSNIYQYQRKHKLDEWRKFCQWIEKLPYSGVITLA